MICLKERHAISLTFHVCSMEPSPSGIKEKRGEDWERSGGESEELGLHNHNCQMPKFWVFRDWAGVNGVDLDVLQEVGLQTV